MPNLNEILWGKYKTKEATWAGPYYPGSFVFEPAETPSWNDIALEVVTSTEGSHYDAVNGYDRMAPSVGLMQWGERGIFGVSSLLGKVMEAGIDVRDGLEPALSLSDATFDRMSEKAWRFRLADGTWVTTAEQQRALFLGMATGLDDGSWDPVSKHLAYVWTISLADVWRDKDARAVQRAYGAAHVKSYALADSAEYLWGRKEGDEPPEEVGKKNDWVGAARAAFLSFAANLPNVANKHLVDYHRRDCRYPKWSPLWCLHLLQELTYGPQIAIYPHRYGKIRPVLERRFRVDLPDFAEDLLPYATKDVPKNLYLSDPQGLQKALIKLGYDLGPAGADGKIGPKTMDAVLAFQGAYMGKRAVDGKVGPKTTDAIFRALGEGWRQREDATGGV